MNWLQRICQNRNSIKSNKDGGPTWDLDTKRGWNYLS